MWVKMVSPVRSATGLGPLVEVEQGKTDCTHPMPLLLGCEKPQDPALGVGRHSLRSLGWGVGPGLQDDRFSGSWTLQTKLDAVEELRTEQPPSTTRPPTGRL